MSSNQGASIADSIRIVSCRLPALAYVADLISLTKPRIMALLLISTGCPMVLAADGKLSLSVVLFALLGGSLVSGSASAINCIWDRDIDSVMERTKHRPMAAGRISLPVALLFSLFIGISGVIVLALTLNSLAAQFAVLGHLYYVLIYTMWLKRSTPQNIVIGGVAGAMPPLVGWAAVTGRLDATAILIFLVVFLWTPPHFWALALNKNEDYKRAGVPMLPIISGARKTYAQMLFYALLLIPVSLLLVASSCHLGMLSFTTFLIVGLVFVLKIVKLMRMSDSEVNLRRKQAFSIFGFSLLYLMLFFVCLVVDSTLI